MYRPYIQQLQNTDLNNRGDTLRSWIARLSIILESLDNAIKQEKDVRGNSLERKIPSCVMSKSRGKRGHHHLLPDISGTSLSFS